MVVPTMICFAASTETNGCLTCHRFQPDDFSPAHDFAHTNCSSCHLGDQTASEQGQAHQALIPKPGDLNRDHTICANCHPQQVKNVLSSLMNTAKGIVQKTRHALGEQKQPDYRIGLESLGHSPADSMLRKLCVSCHLAHSTAEPSADPTQARGGGCSACHINQRSDKRHPKLTTQVEDARCFGCHSRSGRISLNYVGLAEADPDFSSPEVELLQLPDGRSVIRKQNDVHHQAGLSCIDCHTSTGIMGGGDNRGYKNQAVDIQCIDCHASPTRQANLESWPKRYTQMRRYLESRGVSDRQVPLTLRYGTPLWHIEIREDGSRLLHPKLGGPPLTIPDYRLDQHPLTQQHVRLSCSACHSQWAPQCYGCHSRYDPADSQWDHLAQEVTPGRWRETRWDVRAELPLLGVYDQHHIGPVMPGMIMQVTDPDWKQSLFRRLFAPSEPHTTGKARSCDSCHRNPKALGLGEGKLIQKKGHWLFQPAKGELQDGLPADAWTSLDGRLKGDSTDAKLRPFTSAEMELILNVALPSKTP